MRNLILVVTVVVLIGAITNNVLFLLGIIAPRTALVVIALAFVCVAGLASSLIKKRS